MAMVGMRIGSMPRAVSWTASAELCCRERVTRTRLGWRPGTLGIVGDSEVEAGLARGSVIASFGLEKQTPSGSGRQKGEHTMGE